MSLFGHALINSNKKKFLKTIRYELISTPAYLRKTKDKHILLTGPFTIIKNATLLDYYECKMTETAWIIDAYLPFPWEKEYYFKHLYSSIYILQNTPTKTKEVITDEFPKTKTIPRRRRQQTKKFQNVWNSEQTKNGQNPDIIDTLR